MTRKKSNWLSVKNIVSKCIFTILFIILKIREIQSLMSRKNLVANFAILMVLFLMLSCGGPSIKNIGGIILKVEYPGQNISSIETNLENRLSVLSATPENITSSVTGNVIQFELPSVFDTTMVRSLVEWDRSFRLCRGIDPFVKVRVREELANLINISEKIKPYKPSSMIGLVTDRNRKEVIAKISSKAFKEKFPEVRDYYWGVKKMEEMSALFMESSSSAFITEDMFSELEGYASEDNTEGVFSLQLKEEFSDRIGQLTGNDSVYLFHIFHREVYISKIIKPHITRPNFGMSGAFSVSEAKALGAIWASEDIEPTVKILSLDVLEGK